MTIAAFEATFLSTELSAFAQNNHVCSRIKAFLITATMRSYTGDAT